MDHLDRGGYDLSVQKREKKFRNKEREKCMKENIRSNYLLSQKQIISYNLTKFSEIQTVSYCPNITNENVEAPRSNRTCPKTHANQAVGAEMQ